MAANAQRFIPNTSTELTPEWVSAALREAGALPAGRVANVNVEPLLSGGQGMTGEVVRLRLDVEGEDQAPETVVAKFATSNVDTRAMVESMDAYGREIRFYQRYAHRMPTPTPRFYGADYDPGKSKQPGPVAARVVDALPSPVKVWISRNVTKYMRPSKRRYALLIEDLGSAGRVHDLVAPPSPDQVGDALETLAVIHAEFWGDPTLAHDDVFDTIITTTPRLFSTIARKRCIAIAADRYAWFGPAEEAAAREACRRFGDDLRLINERMTLVHGDPRTDNIMFRPDGGVVMLDWALAANGHPGYDVGYLLSSAIGADDLGARAELVARYEGALAALGVRCDSDELREAIDAAYRVVVVSQLLSIAVLDGHLENSGDEMADHWLPRTLAGLIAGWD